MARKFRYPTQVPRGLSAEEENERVRAENLAKNQANIYRPPGAAPMGLDPSQEIQRKLALAFDYDPSNPPPLKQLLAKFHSQPEQVQAGMFEKGLAPIDAATGQKMLHAVRKNRSDVQEEAVDTIGKKYLSGDIIDETVDGKTQFFDMVTEEIPDPDRPLETKKIKKKVPVNTRTSELLNQGIRQGRIQDPKTGKWAEDTEVLKPQASAQSRMSAEEFQKVLDARQAGILEPSKPMVGTDFMQATNPTNQLAPQTMGLLKGAGYRHQTMMDTPDSINSGVAPGFGDTQPDIANKMSLMRAGVHYNPLQFDPNSMGPIQHGPEEAPRIFAKPGDLPGFRRPITTAPSIAANLGWAGSGGPSRLQANYEVNAGTANDVMGDIAIGALNVVPRAANAIDRWLLGDRQKEEWPLTTKNQFKSTYDPRLDPYHVD